MAGAGGAGRYSRDKPHQQAQGGHTQECQELDTEAVRVFQEERQVDDTSL
jgi:hypothetical protein